MQHNAVSLSLLLLEIGRKKAGAKHHSVMRELLHSAAFTTSPTSFAFLPLLAAVHIHSCMHTSTQSSFFYLGMIWGRGGSVRFKSQPETFSAGWVVLHSQWRL